MSTVEAHWFPYSELQMIRTEHLARDNRLGVLLQVIWSSLHMLRRAKLAAVSSPHVSGKGDSRLGHCSSALLMALHRRLQYIPRYASGAVTEALDASRDCADAWCQLELEVHAAGLWRRRRDRSAVGRA